MENTPLSGSRVWCIAKQHVTCCPHTRWISGCLMSDIKRRVGQTAWASYQIRKIAGYACDGNAGNVPDMHHGTCVTHVPWCMPGSLTSGFIWSLWQGKGSRHSRRMRNLQFYISGKRPIDTHYTYHVEAGREGLPCWLHISGFRLPKWDAKRGLTKYLTALYKSTI